MYLESLQTVSLPGMEGSEKIRLMMERLGTIPSKIINDIPVVKMRDLSKSQECNLEDGNFQPSSAIAFQVPTCYNLYWNMDLNKRTSVGYRT